MAQLVAYSGSSCVWVVSWNEHGGWQLGRRSASIKLPSFAASSVAKCHKAVQSVSSTELYKQHSVIITVALCLPRSGRELCPWVTRTQSTPPTMRRRRCTTWWWRRWCGRSTWGIAGRSPSWLPPTMRTLSARLSTCESSWDCCMILHGAFYFRLFVCCLLLHVYNFTQCDDLF